MFRAPPFQVRIAALAFAVLMRMTFLVRVATLNPSEAARIYTEMTIGARIIYCIGPLTKDSFALVVGSVARENPHDPDDMYVYEMERIAPTDKGGLPRYRFLHIDSLKDKWNPVYITLKGWRSECSLWMVMIKDGNSHPILFLYEFIMDPFQNGCGKYTYAYDINSGTVKDLQTQLGNELKGQSLEAISAQEPMTVYGHLTYNVVSLDGPPLTSSQLDNFFKFSWSKKSTIDTNDKASTVEYEFCGGISSTGYVVTMIVHVAEMQFKCEDIPQHWKTGFEDSNYFFMISYNRTTKGEVLALPTSAIGNDLGHGVNMTRTNLSYFLVRHKEPSVQPIVSTISGQSIPPPPTDDYIQVHSVSSTTKSGHSFLVIGLVIIVIAIMAAVAIYFYMSRTSTKNASPTDSKKIKSTSKRSLGGGKSFKAAPASGRKLSGKQSKSRSRRTSVAKDSPGGSSAKKKSSARSSSRKLSGKLSSSRKKTSSSSRGVLASKRRSISKRTTIRSGALSSKKASSGKLSGSRKTNALRSSKAVSKK